MCGFAGILSRQRSPSPRRIQDATNTLKHRGPEDEGYWHNENATVALGHKRLCIIDLDDRSRQPLHFLNRYTIVYNGEIYNFPEIKSHLAKQGYQFKTASDTEVIVAAFDAFGKDCVQQFDGMFSFAIWDEKEQTLFAARDRFGEKPFFFHYSEEEFLFASEMKALWAAGVERTVNNAMAFNFLTIGYTSNPFDQQETFFQHVQKLPSSSFLVYQLHNHSLEIENYWRITSDVNTGIDEKDAIELFTVLLNDSVKKRLRSDVALGSSLSGGLDSSSIVALCQQHASKQYSHKCFTAAFAGFEKSEEKQAAQVAAQFGLQHYITSVTGDDLIDEMDTIMWHQEEPVLSASVVAQYKVYKAAKEEGVTVLLDGQGADEVLGGYHKYYKWYWQELYRDKQLKKSGELTATTAHGLSEAFGWRNKAASLFPDFALAMLQSKKIKDAARQAYLNSDFVTANKKQLYYSTPVQPTLNGALYFNTFIYGLEELLRYADRNSMANAVEVRLPFLHYKLVEAIFTLAPHFKIHQGWTKWLLRKAMENTLPASIVWRKDKVGFEPPQKQWMQNKIIQERMMEGRRTLVDHNILHKSILTQPIKPADAHAAQNNDWRYWSLSYLFR